MYSTGFYRNTGSEKKKKKNIFGIISYRIYHEERIYTSARYHTINNYKPIYYTTALKFYG